MSNWTNRTDFEYLKKGYLEYNDYVVESDLKPFEFEKHDFTFIGIFSYHHPEMSIIIGLAYLAIVFGLQHFMKNREAFTLKKTLFFWNSALGIFSICGTIRVAPELFTKFNQPGGFYRSVCLNNGYSAQFAFWTALFAFSKFLELIETVFIVLKKKPVVVLQWYHHLITMVGTWLSIPYMEPINIYMVVLNYCVHSMMYPYFALKTLGVKVPTKVANLITTCQLLQMIIGFGIVLYSAFMYFFGESCCYRHPVTLTFHLIVGITFNILFGGLFYQNVLHKKKSKIQ